MPERAGRADERQEGAAVFVRAMTAHSLIIESGMNWLVETFRNDFDVLSGELNRVQIQKLFPNLHFACSTPAERRGSISGASNQECWCVHQPPFEGR